MSSHRAALRKHAELAELQPDDGDMSGADDGHNHPKSFSETSVPPSSPAPPLHSQPLSTFSAAPPLQQSMSRNDSARSKNAAPKQGSGNTGKVYLYWVPSCYASLMPMLVYQDREAACCAKPDLQLVWNGKPQPLSMSAAHHILNVRVGGDWPCTARELAVTVEPGKDAFYTVRNRHGDTSLCCESFLSMFSCGPDWEITRMDAAGMKAAVLEGAQTALKVKRMLLCLRLAHVAGNAA